MTGSFKSIAAIAQRLAMAERITQNLRVSIEFPYEHLLSLRVMVVIIWPYHASFCCGSKIPIDETVVLHVGDLRGLECIDHCRRIVMDHRLCHVVPRITCSNWGLLGPDNWFERVERALVSRSERRNCRTASSAWERCTFSARVIRPSRASRPSLRIESR